MKSRRRATVVVAVALFVLALIAWELLQSQAPTEQPPERVAAERARRSATAVPGQPTAVLGSGAVASSDWYDIFFTRPVYPDQPAAHQGGLDERLVALVTTAKKTIDAADYDFDLENVANALASAAQRGVRVRFVTDTDTWTSDDAAVKRAWSILKAARIPVVEDNRSPIMHDKFMVVDGEWVWTGSSNWTVGDTYRLNNNAAKIHSRELAANYTAEFEKMFVARQFGPNKPKGVPNPRLTFGDAAVENYFAPQDNVAPQIVKRLEGAQNSIQFLAFSFTHDDIGKAVIARARAGVKVRGVFETTGSQTRFSEFGPMKQAGLEVYTDGNPYVMHHKVFVIDGRTTIFGSFNFSTNADSDNDENLLIVDAPKVAEAFLGEVERVVAVAKNPPAKKE